VSLNFESITRRRICGFCFLLNNKSNKKTPGEKGIFKEGILGRNPQKEYVLRRNLQKGILRRNTHKESSVGI
jgi:hypothetical protein